jgi:transcriptional regulator with XRE-family HTH domain
MNKLDLTENDKSISRFVDRSFDISDRIHEILTRKGITQREFAEMLGKNESQVSKWLSGTHNFTIKTITHLEVALEEVIMAIMSDNLASISFEYIDSTPTANRVDCEKCQDKFEVPNSLYESQKDYVEYSLS